MNVSGRRVFLLFVILILGFVRPSYGDEEERTITVIEKKLPVGPLAERSRDFIETQMADTRTWQSVVATVPGVVLNPFGQMHVRGDHNLISYILDGVLFPVAPDGQLGPLVDPRFLSEMDLETGSFDPSLSGQLGGIVSLNPLTSSLPSQFEIDPSVGDHDQREFLGYWAGKSEDNSWHYFVGGQSRHTNLRLEAPQPNPQTLNNAGDDSSGFLHLSHVSGKSTYSLGLGRQVTDFGIPNTPSAQSAGVMQHERNANNFALLSWEHVWSDHLESHFGLSWLSATETVTNNGVFTPFTLADPVLMPNANAAGLPANPTDYGSPYLPLISRTNSQVLLSAVMTDKLTENNHLEFGGRADFIHYQDFYDILDAGGIGTLPSSHVNLAVNRNGFSGALFISDHFTFSDRVHADIGINGSNFNDGFQIQTAQLNPLFNLAYALSGNQIIRFSYNHVFNVPPLEPDLTGAVVSPEYANEYDLSYEQQWLPEVKFHVGGYIKNFRNQIDGALLLPLSNIPLFDPRSFDRSLDDGIEVSLHSEHKTGLNGFFNYAYAVAKSVATPMAPSVFLDHDQRHTLTFGTSYRWTNGVYASIDNRYGSGFPQAVAEIYNLDGIFPYGINGNTRIPNFVSNLSLGYKPFLDNQTGLSSVGASLEILNLFNSRPDINFISDFTGTRFVQERQILFNLFSNF